MSDSSRQGRRRPLPTFSSAAPATLGDEQLRRNLRKATTAIRAKRATVAGEMPDWEELRESAREVKEEVLRQLDPYLLKLEAAVTRSGGKVHRARNGAEARTIIGDLVADAGVREVVKVKSITTDEVGLNEGLADRGIAAVETDLAELIIQLAGERSSHFLVPAIHKNRTQIRDLFREALGLPDLTDEPAALAEAARLHLRRKFLEAEVAISGANFAVAETGTVGVVESEGNGRMCLTLPRVLITLMGIEKVLPTFRDLEIFLQLLPRSSTGERMNPYTTLWTGITPGDGPQEFHLVLLDNGRSRVLADPLGKQALHCIRCSACLNICPVYERVGGHAYNATYPGPIGSILTPQLLGPGRHDSLPFASTLCGACADVCPVKIEIPRILLHLRGESVARSRSLLPRPGSGKGSSSIQERAVMRFLGWILHSPNRYRWALKAARWAGHRFIRSGRPSKLPGYAAGWTLGRDLPPVPSESFREWWDRRGTIPTTKGEEGAPGEDARGSPDLTPHRSIPAGSGTIHRRYRHRGTREGGEILDLLDARVSDYRATVVRAPLQELPAALEASLGRRGVRRLVVPTDLPGEWLSRLPQNEVEILRDGEEGRQLSKGQLASCHGVLTGCALAIAETGTIVLDSGPGQGRRALTLLPDYHLCVVRPEDVVETVPEAVRRLEERMRGKAPPLTLISGPSATSDIELVRVEGVHGPRNLEVVIVEGTP